MPGKSFGRFQKIPARFRVQQRRSARRLDERRATADELCELVRGAFGALDPPVACVVSLVCGRHRESLRRWLGTPIGRYFPLRLGLGLSDPHLAAILARPWMICQWVPIMIESGW